MGSWANIAALLRAKNNEGGLSVKPTEGLPFLLEEGMEVTFVPPVLRLARTGCVERIDEVSPERYVVYFDTVQNRTDAEKLEGHFCLVSTDALPEGFDEQDSFDVAGFAVVDATAGLLGAVSEIQQNPAHPILVVERTEGADELLIPLVDEFVVSVDEQDERIDVDVPAGLLEL